MQKHRIFRQRLFKLYPRIGAKDLKTFIQLTAPVLK